MGLSMWLLVLMIMAHDGKKDQTYVLTHLDTQAECERLRDFVRRDMNRWYGQDTSYQVWCEMKV